MPQIPITMPQLGESIAEAAIIQFLVKPGDTVTVGQDVLEVETNKATMSVASPCSGTLSQWIVAQSESCAVGEVLGYILATDEQADDSGADNQQTGSYSAGPQDSLPSEPVRKPVVEPTIRGLPVPAHAAGASYMSPRMKARMHELGLHAADLSGVAGSGAAGRVTVEDFERFIANLEKLTLTPASSMRVAVADAMRRSWTRPIATVGMAVCLDPLLSHRKQQQAKPGPALYALRAMSIALAENRAPAGRLVGKKIVHPPAIDIGFAVEADDGVLVPVIRDADQKSLKDLVPVYNSLVDLARQRKLPPETTNRSIATVTNFGTFGLEWATPIPLPEQTLVLGLGAGRLAPFWDENKQQFIPGMEATLTLSFDHRVLDGGAAGRLLSRIKQLMQQPESL